MYNFLFFFFQAEDGIRDLTVTGVQTCALPIYFGVSLAVLDASGKEIEGSDVTKCMVDAEGKIVNDGQCAKGAARSEEHTSELQSQSNIVCRLLLEKKTNYGTLWIRQAIMRAIADQ